MAALQRLRNGVRLARRAELVLEQPLDDQRQAEGEQQAVEVVEAVDPFQQQPLQERTQQADGDR